MDFFKLDLFVLSYVYECFACAYVCALCKSLVPKQVGRKCQIP